MKNSTLSIILFILLFLGVVFYYFSRPQRNAASPTLATPGSTAQTTPASPSMAQVPFCLPSAIQATVTFEGAAGSTFGTLKLKNSSKATCQIQGNQFIQGTKHPQNVSIQQQGLPGSASLVLAPDQVVYSQVRYPNGAQCSGETKQAVITFTFPISPTTSVLFQNESGTTQQDIAVCRLASEMTEVQVWSISDTPGNQ